MTQQPEQPEQPTSAITYADAGVDTAAGTYRPACPTTTAPPAWQARLSSPGPTS